MKTAARTAIKGLAGLAVAITALGLSATAGATSSHRTHHRSADVTFTKWVVTLPASPTTLAGIQMVGVVGGDVGRGRYAGTVLSDDTKTVPGFWLAHARYEFHGRKHFFVADLHITENDTGVVPITATIQGVVAQGWLRGAQVTGEYTAFDTCPIPTPGNVFGTTCFQGTLHLERVWKH